MRPITLYAPRFRGSTFLAELRELLDSGDEPGQAAMGLDETAGEAGAKKNPSRRIVLLGLPALAFVLAPFLRGRLTLVLDGTEGFLGRWAAGLRGVRVASFDFSLYSAARGGGADAAFFEWAPPPSGGAGASGAEIYVASRGEGGLQGGFLDAMARGAIVVAREQGLFAQYVTRGVSGFFEGDDLDAPPEKKQAIAAATQRVMRQARRRFEEDKGRLRDFIAGASVARRTSFKAFWAPAPRDAALGASGAREGGKRLNGDIRQDLPGAPLVTVAVVTRNARESFPGTLASILAQDYPNVEIVVVDGDSSDGTREEIAVRSSRLDYWLTESDTSPYDGMNKAARLARGRFVIFMNAGDFFAHERAITEAFDDEAAREADVVVGHHIYVDAQGVESLCKNADFYWTFERLAKGELSWEWYSGVPCGQAVFIRAAALREQPFDLSYRIAADHAFLYEACARGRRFFHCGGVIGVYTSGGLSGANDRKTAAEILRVSRAYGPREKIDAWFERNLPIASG